MLSLMFNYIKFLWKRRYEKNINEEKSKLSFKKKHEQQTTVPKLQVNAVSTVTKLNNLESYGIINDDIYFSFEMIKDEIFIGTKVHFQASRKSVSHGWRASCIQVFSEDWDSHHSEVCLPTKTIQQKKKEMIEDEIRVVEGSITEWYGKIGRLNSKYHLTLKNVDVDFQPVVGDMIIANIKGNEVVSWNPKLTNDIKGIVTEQGMYSGTVNDDIIVYFTSCHCNTSLECGKNVIVDVIKSNQNSFSKRAIVLKAANLVKEECSKPCFPDYPNLEITRNLDFEVVHIGKEEQLTVTVINSGKESLQMFSCYFQFENTGCHFKCMYSSMAKVPQNSKISFVIFCKPMTLGCHDEILLIEFEHFILSRKVRVKGVDPMENLLESKQSFTRKFTRPKVFSQTEGIIVIPGISMFNKKPNFAGFKKQYTVPRNLRKIIENCEDISELLAGLSRALDHKNYLKKMTCLLHLEEIQMNISIHEFDMYEVVLKAKGQFLALEVPGLAEGRPSLLMGDRAMLQPPGIKTFVYEGYIHEVQKDDIFLKFNEKFHSSYNGETYDATFCLSRSNFKRMHEAINIVYSNNPYLLFPRKLDKCRPLIQLFSDYHVLSNGSSGKPILWQNSALNNEQKEAVKMILEGRCRSLPFVIFGPPGTGKTVTVVEAILQVYLNFKNARMLICTPSNSAADLISERLIKSKYINKQVMVRINSYQRNIESIPEFLKDYCKDKDALLEACQFPISIATCSTAGSIHQLGLPVDHFTHIFIDEAGQLTEPECLVPISLITGYKNASIILSGDPQQLGPVLLSTHAKTYGLQTSYLERIMEFPCYNVEISTQGHYNPNLVTMLIVSYRSHPGILFYSSQAFYYSKVQSTSSYIPDQLLLNWDKLPKRGFPVIFHGVRGEEYQEQNSPSWFNSAEVVQACQYLNSLYNIGLSPEEVGIITPYKKQVEKLRLFAAASQLDVCKIGSVEEFQGQERRAIIISTVRSNNDTVQEDMRYNLGFIFNPKRFNVAITRAKSILIVIGNPYILSGDPYWRGFLDYCIFNGAYTGCIISSSELEC